MPEIEVQIAPPDTFPFVAAVAETAQQRAGDGSSLSAWPIILAFALYAVLFAAVGVKYGLAEFPKWQGWKGK